MLRKEQEISVVLNDVKNIIAYHGDKCDYETLILDVSNKLKDIDRLLEIYEGEGITLRLKALKEKAEQYLKVLNWYKVKNERAAQEVENEK